MNSVSYVAINELLCRFQEAFDLHDWDLLKECLADQVYTDYSNFRGTVPQFISKENYVQLRKTALANLRMQHNFSNLRITLNEDSAEVRCNYAIYRFASDLVTCSDEFFHSFGHYLFTVQKINSNWKIKSITQVLAANVGNSNLHVDAKPN